MYFMFCQFYVRAIEAVKPLVVRNPHMIDVQGRKKEEKKTLFLFIVRISVMPCKEVPLHCLWKAKMQCCRQETTLTFHDETA